MPLEHHSLVQDFPEYRAQIHTLKSSDAYFAKLFDRYDEIEHEVYRIESEEEAASDERLETLKKKRLELKDEMISLLKKAA